jgi:hypothetical protein
MQLAQGLRASIAGRLSAIDDDLSVAVWKNLWRAAGD